MRILLDYRPALRNRTGVGEYVHELARALAATAQPDESVTLFSASWKDRLSPSAVPGTRTVDRRIPVQLLNLAWHRLGWPSAESLAGGPFDIVHSGHPLLMPARRAARVVTVHDLDFLDHPDRTHAEIRRDYPSLAAPHALRADHVIAVSRHTARQVTNRLGVPESRLTVCSPGAPDWSRRLTEPADGVILFLGSIEPRKNLAVLLDAYEQLRAHAAGPVPRLLLAGRAGAAAAPLMERIGRPPLAGWVDLPGYIDPDRRLEVYDRALVLVIPSHTEGFGIPALEAMTRGIPVIAANRGALPEVVESAGRLIDPDDAQALAHAIRSVVGDRAERDRMREAGWRQAQRFTWRESAREIREAWAMAVERRLKDRD
ncbi:MAG TPA: glycosyltransferase family 1 protein [Vicinamibacterales bacterium]|nr:glycosyltransferase family 1 protein [Vicinamibacterales bacterium]